MLRELESKWKTGVVDYFKVLSRHSSGRVEKNCEKLDWVADAPSGIRSRYLQSVTSWLDYLCEAATVSCIQVLCTVFVLENLEENASVYFCTDKDWAVPTLKVCLTISALVF